MAIGVGGSDMAKQRNLSDAEIGIVKAMLRKRWRNDVIHFYFNKPDRLTDREWEVMRSHSEEGARIIGHLGFLDDAIPAIRHHHERWDGSGYPHGLAGDEIPLGARIIHVADALDSMCTNRVYQSARPLEDALGEVRRGRGAQFCPRCVDAVEAIVEAGELRRIAPFADSAPGESRAA